MIALRNTQRKLSQSLRMSGPCAAIVAILFLSLLNSLSAFAASVASARNAFIRGDLPRTVKMLEPELFPKPRFKGKELEDAREIYGVTQFMLGNRAKAEMAFRQIIQANPRAKLDKRYLLDPAAEPFFESLKKSKAAAPTAGNRKSNRTAATQKPSRAPVSNPARAPAGNPSRGLKQASGRPTPPPEAPRRQAPPAKNRAPQGVSTGLQVTVNAPRATLFADGIFIGPPNQKISLDPGNHQITISAEGYETQEKTVRIEAGRISQLKVNLIKTRSRPTAAPARSSAAQPQRAGNQSKTAGRKGDNLDPNQPKASLNFNQELPAEKRANRSRKNFTDQYFQEPATPQYQQPPAQTPYSQPPQYALPPQYAPPQYSQPQPYQQPYQQPYAYPPPVYANPPPYQAPSPYGYQDPYAQPPPAYSAPPTPGYGDPNPYEEEDEAGDSERPAPRSAGYSRSKKKSRKKGNVVVALLPLGIGQFQNGDTVKGVIFLLGQGGALGFGLTYRLYNIPKDKKLFDTQREEEVDLTPEEKETIEIQREEHIKKLTNYSNYALMGAGALYLIGVIDAIVNLDSGEPTKRRRSDNSLPVPEEKKYKFAISPTPEGGVGLGISMKLE